MGEEVVEIKVDLDKLTFGDLEKFDELAAGTASVKEIVGLLDRAVVGGVRHLPLSKMPEIVEAIKGAMTGGPALKN